MSFLKSDTHKKESWEHWLTKCIVYKLLKQEGHEVYLEVMKGNGVVDIYDGTTQMIYEIEPVKNIRKQKEKWEKYKLSAFVKDLIIIPYNTFNSIPLKEFIKQTEDYLHI